MSEDKKSVLDELTDEEMAFVIPLTKDEIDDALEQGRKDREACEKAQPCIMPTRIWYR